MRRRTMLQANHRKTKEAIRISLEVHAMGASLLLRATRSARYVGVLRALIICASLVSLVIPTAAQTSYARDRVYTADQISNTVSVVDPATNRLLGIIRLGDPFIAGLSPLYKGALLVHGLGFSPDGRTLAVVSIGSNSVTLIDTASNRVKGVVYVGRSPHEAFFTPDGRELWVAVRGENYISVIDPVQMKELRRITTVDGPGMVLFRPDGKYAFVPSSFTPTLCVIDVQRHEVVAKVEQASPFSPNLAVSSDGREVWFTLKDVGRTQVISADPPFRTLAVLDTGPITNHVFLLENEKGRFAYITVGGTNEVKVYRRGTAPTLVATIQTGDLPHGIWGSPDGKRVYIGLENGDAVQVIDTLQNRIVATIPVGQLPQALVYVPNAALTSTGAENLAPLDEAAQRLHVALASASDGKGRATVVVNSLGLVDHLQIAAAGLAPNAEYSLQLVSKDRRETPTTLVKFKTNASGSAIAQTIGPIKSLLTAMPRGIHPERELVLVSAGDGRTALVQSGPASSRR